MNALNVCKLAVATAALVTSVSAHGEMTKPTPRKIDDWYRDNCGISLQGAGDQELRYSPEEQLIQRNQKDDPPSESFDAMNGCRGTNFTDEQTVTTLSPGEKIDVEWTIQAPHPGYLRLSIARATQDGALTKYEPDVELKKVDDFATGGGDGSTTVTLPKDVTGCETPGACVLQFYWHSDVADQTYPTCADIVISGSGSATPAAEDSESAEGSADMETPVTSAPASDASEADYETPAGSSGDLTPSPAAGSAETANNAPPSTPEAPSTGCAAKRRRN